MRQFLLIITCFFCGNLFAQKLMVENMQATNDLSASQNRRNDYNGEPCALIKVQLAAIGATFEGNVIQPVEYKAGEYWVYMTNGSQELRIKHPSFVPLHIKFANYGIDNGLQSLQTYDLTLLIPQLSGIDIDDGMRYLVMSVEPANATVIIDGQEQVVQNGTLSILLPMGEHRYEIKSTAYEPQSGTFTIGNEKLSLPIKLKSNMATLSIGSTTQGTQIYVNDQLRGSSSWTGSLPAGTYRIEGRLKGYRDHRQNIQLTQRDSKQITIPALQAITGALNVNYMPADAEVWLDGKKLGTSPDVFRNIIVGSHQVEIRKQGYATEQKTITINEAQTAQLSGSLTKNSAPVQSSASSTTSSASSSASDHNFRTIKDFTFVSGRQPLRYSVVVGNFSIKTNAEGLSKRLVDTGYSPTIIRDNSNQMFRVIGTTTNDQDEIIRLRNEFRLTYPDSWIMENPNAKENTATTATQSSSVTTTSTVPNTYAVQFQFKKNDLFGSENSIALTTAGQQALAHIANTLTQYPQCHVNITTYYEVQKSSKRRENAYKNAYDKARLGEGRKDAFVNYFTRHGIGKDRIHVVANEGKADAELKVYVP